MLMLHAVMHAHTASSAPKNGPRVTNMLVLRVYKVIYRWRHTHPFIESIKMLNITEPHDQLLHLTFLFRMLSSLYMDLKLSLVTLQHAIMFRFIYCSP